MKLTGISDPQTKLDSALYLITTKQLEFALNNYIENMMFKLEELQNIAYNWYNREQTE